MFCVEDTCRTRTPSTHPTTTGENAMRPGDHTVKWFYQAIVDLTSHLKGSITNQEIKSHNKRN